MVIIAVQQNNTVYAYNEQKKCFLNQGGTLYNYTDKTVAVKNGNAIEIFDDGGKKIATYPYGLIDYSNIIGEIVG